MAYSKRIFTKLPLVLAATLALTESTQLTQVENWFADYQTAPGELLTIPLKDGSSVMMNSDSALSVDFSKQQRHITLHDGEAYFIVAKDKTRPFVVATEAGLIKTVSTEFNVKSRDADVEVTVYDHDVSIALNNGRVVEHLPQGQQLPYIDKPIETLPESELTRIRSWRDRQMVFNNTPLAEVISELNHYRSGKIMIVDDEIKKLPVTFVFATDDPNSALKSIEEKLPVKITRLTNKLALIGKSYEP